MHKQLLTSRDDFFTVRDFLTPAECERYVALSEAAGYGDAPISTFDGPRIVKEMRSNNRVESGRKYVLRSDVMYGWES